MKTKLICFALLLCLASCLGACQEPTDAPPAGDGPEICEKLDTLLDAEVNAVTVEIITVTAGITLKAEYAVTKTSVVYSVDRLNKLEGDEIPEEYKTTLSGNATIENGTVTKIDGDAIDLPTYDQLTGNFSIKKENLVEIEEGEGSLKAKVLSPEAFLGTKVDVKDMTVSITYTDTAITRLTVTYSTSTSTVATVYTFS
ncbi:MAG: hypothetical protein IIY01_03535 [Clostridia bacterium]|nr:hypothetical protein [Clostridia bacterium]MBQ5662479.1 hypothetical protein [Clostridia bacterium]